MVGNDQHRFCSDCQKFVYNLSAMTATDAERLIRVKEGRLCAAFFRRADGTVLTADCPVGKSIGNRNLVYRTAATVASTFALIYMLFLVAGYWLLGKDYSKPIGWISPSRTVVEDPPRMILGMVVPIPPSSPTSPSGAP
jgi:hypothetical protein